MPVKAPFVAASMSASGRMMFGDLPPSSSVTRFSARPALAPISRPTSVEPVKASLSTSGWSTSAAPIWPSPVITLSTPSGIPASSASSPSRVAGRGRDVDDLGEGQGLAVVERLQLGQLVGVLLDQPGQALDQRAAVGGGHRRPGAVLERGARGAHGAVDILRAGLGEHGDRLA